MSDERRRSERLQWIRFESRVCVRRSMFKKEWIPVVPFDFSRFGMGVQTDESYEVGDEVVMSLELESENTNRFIPLMKGIVRYKEKHHSRFNYGVEFKFASKADRLELEKELIWIEQVLQNYETANASEGLPNGA